MNTKEYIAATYKDVFGKEHSEGDSDLWLDLFMYADNVDEDLAARLVYLRNAGTKLVPHSKYGYKLVPVIGEHGWQSMEQYKEEAKCLNPYKSQLVFCLKKLVDKSL